MRILYDRDGWLLDYGVFATGCDVVLAAYFVSSIGHHAILCSECGILQKRYLVLRRESYPCCWSGT